MFFFFSYLEFDQFINGKILLCILRMMMAHDV